MKVEKDKIKETEVKEQEKQKAIQKAKQREKTNALRRANQAKEASSTR